MEVIYDFETLSTDVYRGVIVNIAGTQFDETRFKSNPYTFDELVDNTKLMKFDVEEQVKVYDRKIKPSSLEWWKKQDPEVKALLNPSDEDVSISELPNFMINELQTPIAKRVWSRGNTFDPMLVQFVFEQLGIEDPTPFWVIRDVRSYIEGFTYGTEIRNNFMPNDVTTFKAHNPIHDVAMDVYRLQFLVRTMYGED